MIRNLINLSKTNLTAILILTLVLIGSWSSSCPALRSVSSGDIDTLPEKIYDDLVITDLQSISAKLNEISGDLILSAEKLNVTVRLVNGNVNAIGSEVYLGGRILQSVRLLGNKITTDASVGRNLTIAAFPSRKILSLGSRIEIRNNCRVENDADLTASEIYVKGEIDGTLRADGETVVIGGVIRGNAIVTAKSKLVLEPSCRIEGSLEYTSPRRAEIQEGAQVMSADIIIHMKTARGVFDLSLFWRIILAIGALFVGLVFTLVCRSRIVDLTEILINRFGQSIGIGLLSVMGMVLYTALFLTTFMFSIFYKPVFVLIPILAMAFIIFLLMFYLSSILVAIFLGRIIITRFTGNAECAPGRSLVLGLVISTLVFAIPVIGNIIYLLTTMLGFGALTLGIVKQLKG
jgi:cytoskeletal protein CcmA (bactofilin family)